MQTQIPAPHAKQNQSHNENKSSQSAQAQFDDARPEATAQLHLQSLMADSAQTAQLKSVQTMMAAKPNNTGLPNQLKAGIEHLSGMSMDHVKVHYNSDKPAQLQAHAYAQGSNIHVAPGQEQHLPHEAWHVVQQAQGRVRPTVQMKGDVAVNDDAGLEAEADVMGAKALAMQDPVAQPRHQSDMSSAQSSVLAGASNGTDSIAQRTSWSWVDGAWAAQDEDEPQTAQPTRDGTYAWETIDTAVVEEEEEPEPVVYTLTYGAAHGDLHFGGAPTAKKSKWSITKDAAKTLMETEMTNRMQDIVTAATTADSGQIAWILVADAPGKIGSAVGVPSVSRFQIQLQANSATGDISYHGFPDEQALHTGLGSSRNNLT